MRNPGQEGRKRLRRVVSPETAHSAGLKMNHVQEGSRDDRGMVHRA